jgi:hypothetical protein
MANNGTEQDSMSKTAQTVGNVANVGVNLATGGLASVKSLVQSGSVGGAAGLLSLVFGLFSMGLTGGQIDKTMAVRDDALIIDEKTCLDEYVDAYKGVFGSINTSPLAEQNHTVVTRLHEINEWSKNFVGQKTSTRLLCADPNCGWHGKEGCPNPDHKIQADEENYQRYDGSDELQIDLAAVRRVHSFLSAYGLTDVQIAAILGCATVESHIDFTCLEGYSLEGDRYGLDPSREITKKTKGEDGKEAEKQYGFKRWAEGLGDSPITVATCMKQIKGNAKSYEGEDQPLNYGEYSSKFPAIKKLGIGLIGFTDGDSFWNNTFLRNYADYLNDRVKYIQDVVEGSKGWQDELRQRSADVFHVVYGAQEKGKDGKPTRGCATKFEDYVDPKTLLIMYFDDNGSGASEEEEKAAMADCSKKFQYWEERKEDGKLPNGQDDPDVDAQDKGKIKSSGKLYKDAYERYRKAEVALDEQQQKYNEAVNAYNAKLNEIMNGPNMQPGDKPVEVGVPQNDESADGKEVTYGGTMESKGWKYHTVIISEDGSPTGGRLKQVTFDDHDPEKKEGQEKSDLAKMVTDKDGDGKSENGSDEGTQAKSPEDDKEQKYIEVFSDDDVGKRYDEDKVENGMDKFEGHVEDQLDPDKNLWEMPGEGKNGWDSAECTEVTTNCVEIIRECECDDDTHEDEQGQKEDGEAKDKGGIPEYAREHDKDLDEPDDVLEIKDQKWESTAWVEYKYRADPDTEKGEEESPEGKGINNFDVCYRRAETTWSEPNYKASRTVTVKDRKERVGNNRKGQLEDLSLGSDAIQVTCNHGTGMGVAGKFFMGQFYARPSNPNGFTQGQINPYSNNEDNFTRYGWTNPYSAYAGANPYDQFIYDYYNRPIMVNPTWEKYNEMQAEYSALQNKYNQWQQQYDQWQQQYNEWSSQMAAYDAIPAPEMSGDSNEEAMKEHKQLEQLIGELQDLAEKVAYLSEDTSTGAPTGVDSDLDDVKDQYDWQLFRKKHIEFDEAKKEFNKWARVFAHDTTMFYNALQDNYTAAEMNFEQMMRDGTYTQEDVMKGIQWYTKPVFEYSFKDSIQRTYEKENSNAEEKEPLKFMDLFRKDNFIDLFYPEEAEKMSDEDKKEYKIDPQKIRLYYELWQNYAKWETDLPHSGNYINWWTPEVQLLWMVGGSYDPETGKGLKVREKYKEQDCGCTPPPDYDTDSSKYLYTWMSTWAGDSYTARDITTATRAYYYDQVSGGFDDGTLKLRTEYAYAYYYMLQYDTPYQQTIQYASVGGQAAEIMDEMIAEGRWQTNTSNTLSDEAMPHNDKWKEYQENLPVTRLWDIDSSTNLSYSMLSTLSDTQNHSRVNLLGSIWNGCRYVNYVDNSTVGSAALYLVDDPLFDKTDSDMFKEKYGENYKPDTEKGSPLAKSVFQGINKLLERNGKTAMKGEHINASDDGFDFVKTCVLWSGMDKEWENLEELGKDKKTDKSLKQYMYEATSSVWDTGGGDDDTPDYQKDYDSEKGKTGRGNNRIWEHRRMGPYYDEKGEKYWTFKWVLVPRVLDPDDDDKQSQAPDKGDWYAIIRTEENGARKSDIEDDEYIRGDSRGNAEEDWDHYDEYDFDNAGKKMDPYDEHLVNDQPYKKMGDVGEDKYFTKLEDPRTYEENGYFRKLNEDNDRTADWQRVDWECWDPDCEECSGKGGHGNAKLLAQGDIIIYDGGDGGKSEIYIWLGDDLVRTMYPEVALDYTDDTKIEDKLTIAGGPAQPQNGSGGSDSGKGRATKIRSMNEIGMEWSKPCSDYENHEKGCTNEEHNRGSKECKAPDPDSCQPYNPEGKWTVYRMMVSNYTDDYRQVGIIMDPNDEELWKIYSDNRWKGMEQVTQDKTYLTKVREELMDATKTEGEGTTGQDGKKDTDKDEYINPYDYEAYGGDEWYREEKIFGQKPDEESGGSGE